MKFGDKLLGLRKKNGLSQEELAEKLGVSRQSVSKWESNNAYPETDKIVQICNLFNCSMDDLINDEISDIGQIERKEKNNISTYIDSFLEFITKTINMFGDMKFSSGLKCVIEMIIVGLLLALLGHILVGITSSVISNLFSMIKAYRIIYTVIHSVLSVVWFVVSVIVLVHTFKIRYLNYYDKAKKETEESKNESEKIKLEKKENVVIRDERDKPFAFLSVLSKIVIFFIKLFLAWVAFILICALAGLSTAFILTVIHIGLGSMFIGLSITSLAGIIGCLSLLIIIIKFIFNKKSKSNKLLFSFLLSIVFFGIGIGISVISIKNYKIEENATYNAKTKQELKYKEGLVVQSEFLNDITYEFDETKGDNIELEIDYNDKLVNATYYTEDYYNLNVYVVSGDYINNNFKNTYDILIEDLKNKTIRFSNHNIKVKIISSKATIDKLLENESKAYNFTKENTKKGYSVTGISHKISMNNYCDEEPTYNALTGEVKGATSCMCEKIERDNEIIINCE